MTIVVICVVASVVGVSGVVTVVVIGVVVSVVGVLAVVTIVVSGVIFGVDISSWVVETPSVVIVLVDETLRVVMISIRDVVAFVDVMTEVMCEVVSFSVVWKMVVVGYGGHSGKPDDMVVGSEISQQSQMHTWG